MDREKKKLDGKSFDIIEDNIKKLQELFPEIVTEGKVDIDKLALLFDKARNEDTEGKLDGEERYEFTWKGKKEAIRLAQKQSTGTLRPCREDSVNFDETQNLYIEGDNLEVLRALQSSYRGKVKMIYIDPPYNTGNDFVYKDDFKDNIANYKEKMNEAYKTNTNNDGRYHTNWLNMMYPRLKLARNLLTEDGVIFISINNFEVENLKKICGEVFGEQNFMECITWNKRVPKNDKGIGNIHEYILIYTKSQSIKREFTMAKEGLNEINDLLNELKKKKVDIIESEKEVKNLYKKKGYDRAITLYNSLDENYELWGKINLSWPNGNTFGPTYEVIHPITQKKVKIPDRGWRWAKSTFDEYLDYENITIRYDGSCICGEIWFGKDENTQPSLIKYLKDVDRMLLRSIISTKSDGGIEVENLFEGKSYFSYPKSISLIKTFLNSLNSEKDCIIMDFFSGSATTAHAVMQLNAEDGGKRKFIMVQIPEETDEKSEAFKAGYKNICEIGKERIRRAGKKILEENKDKEGIEDLDIGFKVFKLDSTNLKEWDENILSNKEDRQQSFDDLKNPIKDGRTTEDLVYEIMLKYGVDLTMPIEELEILGSKVYSVGCGYLMICLEDNISLDLIEAIGNEKPNRVVLADKGLTTSDLINGEKILTELGVQDIRTI